MSENGDRLPIRIAPSLILVEFKRMAEFTFRDESFHKYW